MDITKAIRSRHSVRAYLDKPVDKKIVYEILETASFAASGANIQPWQVAIITGQTKNQLSQAIIQAKKNGTTENPDYQYYPLNWFEPFKTRRFECGMALYDALDIPREDKAGRLNQWFRNYQFFDAPVGILFFLHEALEQGSWVDIGMFIQNVMIAALDYDLGTCPQASIAEYPDIVRAHLQIESCYQLVCGMALGYPDYAAPENNYRVARAKVDSFTQWFE